ncbi:MAG TPA: enoyl-CoA hydratase-related protein [Acetobacteraceae bacterium]|nr:enoyl-CoA hydratase-related protein [Acetobacteraceae bacterium]
MPSTVVRTMGEGGVVTLRLNRPEKKNALTREMYAALSDGLRSAAEDEATRVLLLAGGEDFTAGNDIADFAADAAAGSGGGQLRTSAALDFLEAVTTFPKPIVAAVRGVAIGIGTTLLLHCEAAIASRTARLQMPFTRLGIVPEAGSSLLLAARVGQARATWLLMSGDAVDGETAAREGLVTRAVDDAEVEETANAMAAQLAALPPGAVADTKRLLRAPYAQSLAEAMERERAAISERLRSAEARAMFDAFLNRKS